MKEPVVLSLTSEEIRSPMWSAINEYLDTQIAALRVMNDGDKDPITTANIRGRIAAMKSVQAIGKPRVPVEFQMQ